jgi:uncharacterized protein YbaP (TraB family)
MSSRTRLRDLLLSLTLAIGWFATASESNAACVWKVTGPNGGTLFLGGSVHVLRSVDYPLPGAYNRAFESSSRVVFEADPKDLLGVVKGVVKASEYPKGDSLKNHVDPRTYDYLRHFFSLLKIPETKFAKFRPWFIKLMLEAPPPEYSINLGVEDFITRRARANSKPISGLESLRESIDLFSNVSDRESEALLLLTFINAGRQNPHGDEMLTAWRRGDAESLARLMSDSFRDFPTAGEHMLGARNRKWIPKLERFIRSGQTYFVVVGAGHMGGPEGVLALLKTRGYTIEQL